MQPFTIFISYRRIDTAAYALLLKYEIEKRFQFVRVYVDIEDITPSQEFPDRIAKMIAVSSAVIVLIGESWIPSGFTPSSKDWISKEIRAAFRPMLSTDENPVPIGAQRKIVPFFVGIPADFKRFNLNDELDRLTSLQAIQIEPSNWPHQIGATLDSLAVSLGLKRRFDTDEFPEPKPTKARTSAVSVSELAVILRFHDYNGWYVDNFGDADASHLVKLFKFDHFNEASEFVAEVSEYVKILDHHPDWRNVFNQVTVSLTTWDAKKRITIYDLNLALFMNKVEEKIKLNRAR